MMRTLHLISLLLEIGFFLAGFALAYWFLIRPILKTRPELKDFYEFTDSFWTALWMKVKDLKAKLSSALLIIGGLLVGLHDFFVPLIANVDWSPIVAKVPPAVWPFVLVGIGALFSWLRNLTDRSQEVALAAVAAGADPEQAKIAPQAALAAAQKGG